MELHWHLMRFGDITENNVKQGEYLNYLLERYCIELVHSENMELASKYIKFTLFVKLS